VLRNVAVRGGLALLSQAASMRRSNIPKSLASTQCYFKAELPKSSRSSKGATAETFQGRVRACSAVPTRALGGERRDWAILRVTGGPTHRARSGD